jgi:Fe-Mn family superoxide dismutase
MQAIKRRDAVDLSNADRRDVLKLAVTGVGAAMATAAGATTTDALARIGSSSLQQPALPFAADALAPVISARTIGLHYGKHHKGYFDNIAKLVKDTPMASESLEALIVASASDPMKEALFNNAAQAWNHSFYWNSLSPKAQAPSGKLAAAIDRDFGSLADLKTKLASASVARFGSGWGWLVSDAGKLQVVSTSNADVPFLRDQVPLLTIDVWEHAYYLDYENRRAEHVNAVIDKALNWEFATRNFERA